MSNQIIKSCVNEAQCKAEVPLGTQLLNRDGASGLVRLVNWWVGLSPPHPPYLQMGDILAS